jgi:acyl-CoA synthetase (AMP-forming)/AMP-acid ligase II
LTSERLLNRLDSFFDAAESLRRVRWVATEQIADSMAGIWRPADVEADTLAFPQYISGSTGAPKGVTLTHRILLYNQEMIRLAFRQAADSVIVGWLPLYHDMEETSCYSITTTKDPNGGL